MTDHIVPFGKYKGKPIEELAADAQYRDWVMAQEWFRERFARLYAMMAASQTASETPEHNAMQAKFLDDRYCLEFAVAIWRSNKFAINATRYRECLSQLSGAMQAWNEKTEAEFARFKAKKQAEYDAKYNDEYEKYKPNEKTFGNDPNQPYRKVFDPWLDFESKHRACLIDESNELLIAREFEDEGADLSLMIEGGFKLRLTGGEYSHRAGFETVKFTSTLELPEYLRFSRRIELKPTVGDDYPSVLRQASSSKCNVVMVGNYHGVGASLDQVRQVFASKNIRFMLESEIVPVEIPTDLWEPA